MGNFNGLIIWFQASEKGSDSDAYKALATKFSLSDEEMEKIVGSKSMISMIMQNINGTIINEPNIGLSGGFDEYQLCRL